MKKLILTLAFLCGMMLVFAPSTPVLAAGNTTTNITASIHDGYLWRESGIYANARGYTDGYIVDSTTDIWIGQYKHTPTMYRIHRAVVQFDTSFLADITDVEIHSVELLLYCSTRLGPTYNYNIVVVNATGTGMPLISSNYGLLLNRTETGGTIHIDSFLYETYNTITLNATGRSWIVTDGWTQLGLRTDREIAGTVPELSEYVKVHSYEGAYRPILRITHTSAEEEPAAPAPAATTPVMPPIWMILLAIALGAVGIFNKVVAGIAIILLGFLIFPWYMYYIVSPVLDLSETFLGLSPDSIFTGFLSMIPVLVVGLLAYFGISKMREARTTG